MWWSREDRFRAILSYSTSESGCAGGNAVIFCSTSSMAEVDPAAGARVSYDVMSDGNVSDGYLSNSR